MSEVDDELYGLRCVANSLARENAELRGRVDMLECLLKLTLKHVEEGELCDMRDHLGTFLGIEVDE